MVYFPHVLKKYVISGSCFLQISHHRLSICKVYFPLFAEEVCHFKLMFSANLASQFGHLFSCAEETCHFNLTYCKYCITVWAFLSFIGRNMIFQSPLFLQILHQSRYICMVYFSYVLKKYDLSKYSFLQISHHSWGIS